jgi:Kef-type K+ transport system membrane component KefB
MAGHGGKPTDFVRKGLIVVLLFVGVLLLYHYAAGTGQGTGSLLALGFVILSAYLIGELVEVVRLPHITGYLLAGLFLGPSLGETLHHVWPELQLLPPFDKGILNADVISQLTLLDTLALPLICLSAGGALRPKEIRKAILPIAGILGGQIIAMFVGVVGLFYLLSGPLPFLQMPALAALSVPSVLALGGVAAAISIATSDAATIAIVVSSKARGPMTTNIISVAVLKDVVVVVAFSAMTGMASSSLGIEGGSSLQQTIAMISLSGLVGVGVGWVLHLYLKFVGVETLLFLVGLIYTMSYVSEMLHLENALVFIMAGFVASNWSEYGDRLIGEVGRLSTPVFVVFFTLAGAKLHLDVLAQMAVFAFLLVAVRASAFYIGVKAGGSLCNADAGSRKYGWMGFVSQAGLAITLANTFPDTYGPALGGAMFSFILAGVAVNEIIGPALLQAALSLAGELPRAEEEEGTDTSPVPVSTSDAGWPELPGSDSDDLQTIFFETRTLFQQVHADFVACALHPRQQEVLEAKKGDFGRSLPKFLMGSGLLDRWEPRKVLLQLDELADSLSDGLLLPVESCCVEPSEADGRWMAFRRSLARTRQGIRPSERLVDVRMVGRYHFSGHGPSVLRDFAEGLIALETDLARASEGGATSLAAMEHRFGLLGQELQQILGRLHLRFCLDLLHVSTFSLPSWQRRFGLAFEERNRGLEALHVGWDSMRKVLDARWEAANFQLDFAAFSSAVRSESVRFLDEAASLSEFVSVQVSDVCRESSAPLLLLQEPADADPSGIALSIESLQCRLSKAEERITTLVGEGGNLKLDRLSTALRREACVFPKRLRILTDMESCQWSMLEAAAFSEVDLRSYVTGYIEAHLGIALQGAFQPLGPHFGELNSVLQDLGRILEHSQQILSSGSAADEQDAASWLAALERIHLRAESLATGGLNVRIASLKEEVPSLLSAELGSLRSQIAAGRPLQELAIGWQSRAVRMFLSVLRLALSGLLPTLEEDPSQPPPIFLEPHAGLLDDAALYCQLFDIHRGESVPLSIERVLLRNQAHHRLRMGRSAVFVGPLAEGMALADSIASHWTGPSVVRALSGPIGIEALRELAMEAGKGLVALSGLPWLESGKGEALEWLCSELASPRGCRWLLVAESDHWEALRARSALPGWTGGAIRLPPLSAEETRQAILSRHQLSGFGLAYSSLQGALPRLRRSVLGLDREGDWFQSLHSICGGDLEEAFTIWLSAVERIDREEGVIHMGPCGHGLAADLGLLQGLDLVFLRQLLRNGWTSPERAGRELGSPSEDASAWLRRLSGQGLVEESNGFWRLRPYLRYSLQEALRCKGWIQ